MKTTTRAGYARRFVPTVLLSSFGAILVYFRVSGVLPTVFVDELIYQRMSFENNFGTYLGNGLFSSVFSMVESLGLEFYGAVKAINTSFLFIFGVAVGLYAERRVGPWLAGAFAFAAIFGPAGVYTSFFMPEIMFFSIMAVSIYLFDSFLNADSSKAIYYLALFLVCFAAASVTKPHALLLLPVFLVFMLMKGKESLYVKTIKVAGSLFSVVGLNILFTWILAPGRPPLFAGYTPGGFAFFGEIIAEPEVGTGNDVGGQLQSTDFEFFSFLVTQLAGFGLITFAAIGFFALITVRSEPKQKADFVPVALVGWLLIVIIAFSLYLTLGGDDHTDRVLLRYIEWLFIYVAIIGVSKLSTLQELSPLERNLLGLAALLQGLAAFAFVALEFDTKVSDTIFGTGIANNPDSPWLLALLSVVIAYVVIRLPEKANPIIPIAAVLLFSGLGFSAQQYQIDVNGVAVSSDKAGYYLYENYGGNLESPLLIIGADRTLNQSSIFWSREFDAELQTTERGRLINVSESPVEQFVVTLDEIQLTESADVNLVHSGEDFLLYRVNRIEP